MSNALVSRSRLERIVALAICLWLGLGPIASASPLWGAGHDCCCGSGSFCRLGGCDCGEYGTRDDSPCGGLRPAKDIADTAVVLSFVRDLGVGSFSQDGITIELRGPSLSGDTVSLEPAPTAPEPPPPRSATAF